MLPSGASDFCFERDPFSDPADDMPIGDDVNQRDGGRPDEGRGGDRADDDPVLNEGERGPGSTQPPVPVGAKDAGASDGRLEDASTASPGPAVVGPPPCEPSAEHCDRVDNDCDGAIDEQLDCGSLDPPPAPCAPTLWYRDCDGDGYAADARGSAASCAMPPHPEKCRSWTSRAPSVGQTDCDDSTIAFSPGNNFGVRGLDDRSSDLNCDGVVELKIERVVEPSVVDRKPRDDAQFCKERQGGLRSQDCECFVLYSDAIEPPVPTCAAYANETVPAFYKAFHTTDDSTICYGTVTFSTGTIDAYQIRVLCR